MLLQRSAELYNGAVGERHCRGLFHLDFGLPAKAALGSQGVEQSV